jgi:hypothetical protein
VPVGLSAFSVRTALPTVTAIVAIALTAAGHGHTAMSMSQALNRALVISLLFLAPLFLAMIKLKLAGRDLLLASRFVAWATRGDAAS